MSKQMREEVRHFRREATGVALTIAGVLILYSLTWRPDAPIPEAICWMLETAVGHGAYVIPIAALAVGVITVVSAKALRLRQTAIGVGLLFLVFLTILHLQTAAGNEWDREAIHQGGGVLGAAVAWMFRRVFGQVGSYILLVGIAIVALLHLSDVPARDVLARVGAFMARTAGGIRRRIAERRAARRAEEATRQRAEAITNARRRTGSDDLPENADQSETPERLPPIQLAAVFDEPESELPMQLQPHPTADAGAPPEATPSPQQMVYQFPSLDLLADLEPHESHHDREEATDNIILVEDTLASFGVSAKVVHYERGPAVTRYEVEPARGTRVSKIAGLADELSLALAATDVRVEVIPGKSVIGIEVPNRRVSVVGLKGILKTEQFRNGKSKLTVALGRDLAGEPVFADLGRMPHVLIGGATNAGKSVCLNAMICSILFRARPDEVQFIMIDPKRVELTLYDGIPHLFAPVVHTAEEAADVLRKVIGEMHDRYDRFALAGVRDIGEFNAAADAGERMPYVVIFIDELADLMMQAAAEFELCICRIAQLARATGIHLVVATQRPSVNVVTGTIKANIPSRIALAVAQQVDSRVILDGSGAERLIGRGDMLYLPVDFPKPVRLQGAFVSSKEAERLAEHLREQGEPQYSIEPEVELEEFRGNEDMGDDSLFVPAAEFVLGHDEASVSMLQRRFKIGYARAGRLIDMMEKRSIVGPYEGSKPRRVLMSLSEFQMMIKGDPMSAAGDGDGHAEYGDADDAAA